MVALALAAVLALETPKLIVPNLPPAIPDLSVAMSTVKPLALGDVNDLAQSYVKSPKAKLFARLDGATLKDSDRATLELSSARAIGPREIDLLGEGKGSHNVVRVSLAGLDPEKKYVVVLRVRSNFSSIVRFGSSVGSVDVDLGKVTDYLPIALAPKAKFARFRLEISGSKAQPNTAQLSLYGIDVYSV